MCVVVGGVGVVVVLSRCDVVVWCISSWSWCKCVDVCGGGVRMYGDVCVVVVTGW